MLDRLLAGKRDRLYLKPFAELVTNRAVHRAVVLMGPRRVGKTVILRQIVRSLIRDHSQEPKRIFFASLENPIYRGRSLADILAIFMEAGGHDRFADLWVFFDEIQYVEEWEAHLKVLVDDYPNMRFVVSGSAAAALRMKSLESGAGRFTDFLLPPLLFTEYLDFIGAPTGIEDDIEELNKHFLDYINFGGFPEAVLNADMKGNMPRFVTEDIVEKALLRDLPSLYGIDNPNELYRFFASLVYNSGQEVSVSELCKDTGIPKNTIYKYFQFLEAAFLIQRLYRIDEFARRPQKEMGFKVYVTNPCLRAAMFAPVTEESDANILGGMVETAMMAQLVHSSVIHNVYYARWRDGEVDLVTVDMVTGKPVGVEEYKWSDRIARDAAIARHIVKFSRQHGLDRAFMTTKTIQRTQTISGVKIHCIPTALACLLTSNILVREQLEAGKHPRSNDLGHLEQAALREKTMRRNNL
jgi:predicted AAA+ superfamily ATPase